MRTLGKILFRVLLTAIALPLAASLILQFPSVQTKLVERVAGTVSGDIVESLSIGRFHYLPPGIVVLDNVHISDKDNDTLLHCGRLLAIAKASSLFRDTLEIRRISLSNGLLHIKRQDDSTTNLSALIAERNTESEESSPLPWTAISLRRFRATGLQIKKDSATLIDIPSARIDDAIYGRERLGCRIRQISANAGGAAGTMVASAEVSVCDTSASVAQIRYADNCSDIRIPLLSLRYSSLEELKNNPGNSAVSLMLDTSRVGLGSAALFDPGFAGADRYFTATGKAGGRVNDIAFDGITIMTESGKSRVTLSGNLKGLPDIGQADYTISLNESVFTIDDILKVASEIKGRELPMENGPGIPAALRSAKIRSRMSLCGAKGRMSGTADIRIAGSGRIAVDAQFNKNAGPGKLISGTVSTCDLDIGRLTSNGKLGRLSADVSGSVIFGKDTSVYISELLLNKLELGGYRYHDIRADAEYRRHHIIVNASGVDTNLTFNVFADCDIQKGHDNRISTFLELSNANLDELKLTDNDARISFLARNDIIWTADRNVLGKINIGGLKGKIDNGEFNVGEIRYRSEYSDGIYNIRIDSDLLDGQYSGTSHPAEVFEDIKANLSEAIPLRVSPRPLSQREQDSVFYARMTMKIGDVRHLMAIVYPKLYIDPETGLDFSYKDRKHLEIKVNSSLLAYNNFIFKDVELGLTGGDERPQLEISSGTVQSGEFKYMDNRFTATLDSNRIDARMIFDNSRAAAYTDKDKKADISASILFCDTTASDTKMIVHVNNSSIDFKETHFSILPATIRLDNEAVGIDSLTIQNRESRLFANGTISSRSSDTLQVVADDFDLEALNVLFIGSDIALEGHMSGSASVSCIKGDNFSFFTGISADNIAIGGSPIGDFRIMSKWDRNNERINLLVGNSFEGRTPFNVSGWYKPATGNLDVNVSLDSMSVNYVPELAPAVFIDMDGTVSGDIHLSGSPDSLQISSSGGRLNDVYAVVEYTRVPYRINGGFSVDSEGVKLNGIRILDQYGSKAVLNGGFAFNNFKSPELDLRFDVKNILGVNTTYQRAADGFYGDIKATGKVRIHGPVKGLMIDINARTESGNIHIPNSDSYKRKNALLTFSNAKRSAENAFDSLITVKNGKANRNIKRIGTTTRINVEATPAVTVTLDLGSNSSDVINVTGSGNLELLSGNNHFEAKGVYALTGGNCKMSIFGISAKDFTVLDGSTINFNGELDKTEFNAVARYSTKASIETLIGDNSSVATRRTVFSDIHVSGSLANPELKFKVNVPDLEPATKARVENALSTDEKNLKQSVALLVSGSFVPDENGGIVNSSTLLYSNASEILSNQVSNIFHQLDIPVDLGFKYQPASNGMSIFDVAVSTQLFHNRVNINGSIGNQQYMTGGASTEIVGNVDVEIKLNKSGKLRLNLFSHAADKYSNYLDQTQRNGIGIAWQEEFNTWRELWNNILRRSRKQENR